MVVGIQVLGVIFAGKVYTAWWVKRGKVRVERWGKEVVVAGMGERGITGMKSGIM